MPPPRRDLIAATSHLVSLARAGSLSSARKVFDEMPHRDTVAWNAMLSAYARSEPRRALALFARMTSCTAVAPDLYSFTSVLAASAQLRAVRFGRTLHALVHRLGFLSSLPVSNALVDMYAKCCFASESLRVFEEMGERNEVSWCSLLYGFCISGQFGSAHQLFDEMPVRNAVAWNTMIVGYFQIGEAGFCIELFKRMLCSGGECDAVTFASLMNACSELSESCFGCMLHGFVVRTGWAAVVEVSNSVLSFYAKFGFRDEAFRIFESMEGRTQVSWNAIIDANMRVGDVERAVSLFRQAPEVDCVSCTAVIAGLSRNGCGEEALVLFHDMIDKTFKPDDFSYGAVLHACASIAALESGRVIHGSVIQGGYGSYLYVGNGLMDMYAKCGDIYASSQVFNSIVMKDLVSWNTMLFAYALHGRPSEAFELYDQMIANNVAPDKVTFTGLLTACGHSGLHEQVKSFYEKMVLVHGVEPDAEHLCCVIDMLGRAGKLEEACGFLRRCSSIDNQLLTNESLLNACSVQGEVMIGSSIGKELVSMEPENEVGYVMLSNLYCSSGRFNEAQKVRKAMVEQGLRKLPGCSWIEVRGDVMVFVSGSQIDAPLVNLSNMIELLNYEIRNPGRLNWT